MSQTIFTRGRLAQLAIAVVAIGARIPAAALGQASSMHTSPPFKGAKVNGGTVTHSVEGGQHILTLSSDFKVPDTPAPHWQLVDSRGNTYLLNRLVIKGDKLNRSITVPDYVPDIAKVEIWCAWAETLLGETTFGSPIDLGMADMGTTQTAMSSRFSGPKADTGSVTFMHGAGHRTLTLSEEFVVPDTPAPHWQIVDSSGRTYLLQRLVIKGDKLNQTITVPAYVPDVASVQIWCAWAETLLGEAPFERPVK